MKNNESQKWDKLSKNYDKFLNKERIAYEYIGNLIKKHNSNKKTVELCAGTGILTEYYLDNFKDIIISDFSKDMNKICKRKFPNSDIRIIDCTDTQFKDKTFDLVIMMNAIHIIPNPEKTLKEIRRILKDDGILIVANYLEEESILQKIKLKILSIVGVEFYNIWDFESIKKHFKDRDFEIIYSEKISSRFPLAYLELKKLR